MIRRSLPKVVDLVAMRAPSGEAWGGWRRLAVTGFWLASLALFVGLVALALAVRR